MIVGLAFCHKDAPAALRLLRIAEMWIKAKGPKLDAETIVLASTRIGAKHSLSPEIEETAKRMFGVVRRFVPDGSNENGWPQAVNFIFRETLTYVEREFHEDLFWIEPDCVLVSPNWYARFETEYYAEGKPFMGCVVNRPNKHMNGVGIYGKDWRSLAPKLVEARNEPWDVYSSDQMMPHVHHTRLLQHIWKPPHLSPEMISPGAAIFHQDKDGLLARSLDNEFWGGTLFCQETSTQMKRFFYTDNATRPRKGSGYEFVFEPVQMVGGTPTGVLEVSDEGQCLVLASLAEDPRSGVREIPEAEYQGYLSKKAESRQFVRSESNRQVPTGLSLAGVVAAVAKPSAAVMPPAEVKPAPVEVSLGRIIPSAPVEMLATPKARRGGKAARV